MQQIMAGEAFNDIHNSNNRYFVLVKGINDEQRSFD